MHICTLTHTHTLISLHSSEAENISIDHFTNDSVFLLRCCLYDTVLIHILTELPVSYLGEIAYHI